MKHFSKFMAAMMVLSSMSIISCSEENVNGPTGPDVDPEAKNVVYSKIRFRLPESSRSTTKEGEEIGTAAENNIGSILVVLATKGGDGNYTYLTHALSDATVSNTETSTHTIVFQNKTTLIEHAGEEVSIFAYCNPTEALRSTILTMPDATDKTFTDLICNENVETTWSGNGFLMTNATIKDGVKLGNGATQAEAQADIKTHNTPENALDLGTVEVIRTACRLDYRDGSPAETDPFTYNIKDPNDDTKTVAKVRLNRMALVNRRNEFYYLPRVNDGNKTTPKVTLCPGLLDSGMEINTPGWIVSPTTASFTWENPTNITKAEDVTSLEWTALTDLAADDTDDTDWTGTVTPSDGYKIWTYTTENTNNGSTDLSIQKTTGILFEAEISDVEGADGTAPMYLFGNTIYATAARIKAAAEATPVSNIATAYHAAFNTDGTPKSDQEVMDAGFSIYNPTTGADGNKHYFCYYWYYIKHNDDSNPTTTGTMEYATVRNNIYKLSVTNIKGFGAYKPDEKVEDWDAYFKMSVQVKKWVVRVNNIEL